MNRKKTSVYLAACLYFLSWPLAARDVLLKQVVFRGISAIPVATLRTVCGLEAEHRYTFAKLRDGANRVIRFYHSKGMMHAKLVSAHLDLEGRFLLEISEGRIHEIRILNKNIYTIYRFKRILKIKRRQIYNSKALDEEMKRLKKKFRLKTLSYTSKPAPGFPGEVNLYIDARGYRAKSFSYTFDAEAFYLIPKVGYRNFDFWGLDHEINLYAMTKFEILKAYDHIFGLEYFFPSIFGKVFRPLLKGELQLLDRSREDMNIDYKWNRLQISLSMETRLAEHLNIRAGVSHFIYSIHDITAKNGSLPVSPLATDTGQMHQPGFSLSFDFLDPEGRYNRDKAFRFTLDLNTYINNDGKPFVQIGIHSQKTFERHFDDFILDFRYWYLSKNGDYFHDQEVTGVTLRGYTPNRIFTRHLISLNLEYKLSLWKRYVKLIFFADTALYRPIEYDGTMHESDFKLQGSFGEGFEVNISEFSFRFFYGVPYQNNLSDGRIKVQLHKVF